MVVAKGAPSDKFLWLWLFSNGVYYKLIPRKPTSYFKEMIFELIAGETI